MRMSLHALLCATKVYVSVRVPTTSWVGRTDDASRIYNQPQEEHVYTCTVAVACTKSGTGISFRDCHDLLPGKILSATVVE